MNKWTDRQVDLLKRYYGELSVDDMCIMLEKSKSAIYSKVHYLRKRGWAFKWKSSITSIANSVLSNEKFKKTESSKNVEIVCITPNLLHEEETLLTQQNGENIAEEWVSNFHLVQIDYTSSKKVDTHKQK